MTSMENAKIKLFGVIINICEENLSALSGLLPFEPVFNEFKSLFDELEKALITQGNDIRGVVSTKLKRRKSLENTALILSDAMFTYANSVGAFDLAANVHYAPTRLKKAKDRELVGICTQLTLISNGYMPQLAPYGIDVAWMSAFEDKISDFVAFIGAPANARSEKAKATEKVKILFPQLSAFLKLRLDPMMTLYKESFPDIYGQYKAGRKMVRPATEKPALKGKVTDTEGKPLKGLQVTIAKTARKSITTALGNFRFKRLADGTYTLIVKEKKKEVARQAVEVPVSGEVEIIIN